MSEQRAIKWQLHAPMQGYYTVVYPQLANEIGLNESLMLVRIAHWISISNNLQDGMYWTYQSLRDIQENAFPFWSIMTISRIIKSLVNSKYIVTGNYNKRKGDQTQWFALVPDTISRLKSVVLLPIEGEVVYHFDTPTQQNDTPTQQNDTTLPNITTKKNSKRTNAPDGATPPFSFKAQKPTLAYWNEHSAALNVLREANGTATTMYPVPGTHDELKAVIKVHQDLHRNGITSPLAIQDYLAWLQRKYTFNGTPPTLYFTQMSREITLYQSQQANGIPNGKRPAIRPDLVGHAPPEPELLEPLGGRYE